MLVGCPERRPSCVPRDRCETHPVAVNRGCVWLERWKVHSGRVSQGEFMASYTEIRLAWGVWLSAFSKWFTLTPREWVSPIKYSAISDPNSPLWLNWMLRMALLKASWEVGVNNCKFSPQVTLLHLESLVSAFGWIPNPSPGCCMPWAALWSSD